MAIKAVLFDMDGVLIDARDWHYEALNEALAHFGYTISRESHLSTFDGLPTSTKLRMLSQALGLPAGLHGLINQLKQKYTIQHSYNLCRPRFNHRQALGWLASSYQIAVCSNSIRNTIETMMDLAKLSDYLNLIVSNQDVKKPKPDPEMYLVAMEKLNVNPEECLIIEDNDHGVQAALASGGHLLRVANPDDVTLGRIKMRIDEINNKN
jgi:beta-phosphoglucomutase